MVGYVLVVEDTGTSDVVDDGGGYVGYTGIEVDLEDTGYVGFEEGG